MVQKPKPSRLTKALFETVDDMRRGGVMDEATHQEIAQRHFGAKASMPGEPIPADDIRFATLKSASYS